MISIVCSDPSHEGKIAKLAEFNRTIDDPMHVAGEIDWSIESGKLRSRHRGTGDDAPKVIPYDWRQPRYRLECRLCGLQIVVTHRRLVPLLDRARDAGVSSIPLSALVATLS